MEEKDLVLGPDEEQAEETEPVINDYDERADIRADIDSVIAAYNFLEEVDPQGSDVLRWGLKRKVLKAKKQCLQILCDSIDLLQIQRDEDSEEED
jgi:hypothetical protein